MQLVGEASQTLGRRLDMLSKIMSDAEVAGSVASRGITRTSASSVGCPAGFPPTPRRDALASHGPRRRGKGTEGCDTARSGATSRAVRQDPHTCRLPLPCTAAHVAKRIAARAPKVSRAPCHPREKTHAIDETSPFSPARIGLGKVVPTAASHHCLRRIDT